MDPNCTFPGALALEIRAAAPACGAADAAATESLLAALATDLVQHAPAAARLDLALLGAHYDPAELLRPGFPVHAALSALAARAPGDAGARLLAFGARRGALPDAVPAPDPALAGGALRLLPWLLRGEAGAIAAVGRTLEERLLDAGMAGAATALTAQQLFALPLEHARLVTLYDLAALTAAQYQHAGLAALWRIVEATLFDPHRSLYLFEDGPPLLACEGRVRIGAPTAGALQALGRVPEGDEAARAQRYWQARVQQYRAVLQAHGIEAGVVDIEAGEDPQQVLRGR